MNFQLYKLDELNKLDIMYSGFIYFAMIVGALLV